MSQADRRAGQRPVRVLVAEDDEDIRRLLETVLAERFEVSSVAHGREALAALTAQAPDILLLDLELPGLCGEAVALKVRALQRPPQVFLMSGDHERLRHAGGLQCRATIAKPFSPTALLETLARAATEHSGVGAPTGLRH